MIDLLELHKFFIGNHLHAGDIAVDFTMGNGHDTAYLSKAVGSDGFVYAFDIQEQALASTQERLVAEGCPDNYRLILDSHSNVKKYVDVPFKAGMFNLGWLPGGDKSVTTLRETTLPAIRDAIDLMDRDAILNIAVYPGHAEGEPAPDLCHNGKDSQLAHLTVFHRGGNQAGKMNGDVRDTAVRRKLP